MHAIRQWALRASRRAAAESTLVRLGISAPTAWLLVLAAGSARAQDAELAGARERIQSLPGLGGLDLSALARGPEPGVFSLETPNGGAKLLAFQVGGSSVRAWHVALSIPKPGAIDLAELLPHVDQEILGAPRLSQLVFVSHGADERVEAARLPSGVRSALAGFADGKGVLDWMRGGSVYATCVWHDEGVLSWIAGRPADGALVRVAAALDAASIARLLQTAGFQVPLEIGVTPAARRWIELIAPESTPFPFSIAGERALAHVIHRSTRLKFEHATETSTSGASGATWEASGSQQSSLWLGGRQLDIASTLSAKSSASALELSRTGSATVDWKDAFGVPGLVVNSVSLAGKLSQETARSATRERSNATVDAPSADGRAPSPAGADRGPNPRAEPGAGSAPTGASSADVGVGLVLTLPRSGEVASRVAVRFDDQGVRGISLALSSADGGLDLSAFPGLREVPQLGDLRIREAELGIDGVTRDVYVAGAVAWPSRGATGRGALVSFTPKGGGSKAFVLFLQTQGVTLRTLLPALTGPLSELELDRGMLAISSKDFEGLKAASMPGPVKQMIASVTGALERQIPVFSGLTLMARFDPRTQRSGAAELCARLGVTEPLVVAGALGGLADQRPSIALYGDLPTLPTPKHGPLSMLRDAATLKPGRPGGRNLEAQSAGARLFIVVASGASGNYARFGAEGRFAVRIGDDDLLFSGSLYSETSAISQGLRVAGQMLGEWDAPLGLTGISYRDLTIGGGVDADSSVELALGGRARIGKLDYELRGLLSVIAASGGLVPKKVAFEFEGSEISALTQVQLMSAFAKAAASGPLASAIPEGEIRSQLRAVAQRDLQAEMEKIAPLPMIKLRNVGVHLVTPGASFPGLDLNGMGIGVRGELLLANRTLGRVNDYLTLADGFKIDQVLGDVELGVLTLRDARLDVRIPMPGILDRTGDTPRFVLSGKSAAGCSAVSGAIEARIARNTAAFETAIKLAEYRFETHATAELARWPDFSAKAEGPRELVEDVAAVVKRAVSEEAAKAKSQIEGDVAAAKARVVSLQASKDKAVEAVKNEVHKEAEDQLNSMRSDVKKLSQRHADKPVVKSALEAATEAASKVKLAKDGTIEGAAKLRASLDEISDRLEKLPKAVGEELREGAAAARKRIEAAAAKVASLKQRIENSQAVRSAESELQKAKSEAANVKALVRGTAAPVAAFAATAVETLTITRVGFDSNLGAVCEGRMPKLTLWGTFKGKPFELREALELARKQDLAQKNAANLAKLVKALLDQLDPKEADAFVESLAR